MANSNSTPQRRCECRTRNGGQCRKTATAYIVHNGREYLACKQHHSNDFRPTKGVNHE